MCLGLGLGLTFLPSMVAVGFYFERKRALATGIASSGAGCGILVLSLLAAHLLDVYDWRNALLILAAVEFHSAIAGALCRPLEVSRDVTETDEKAEVNDVTPSVNQTLLKAALLNSSKNWRPVQKPRKSHSRTVSENLGSTHKSKGNAETSASVSFSSDDIQNQQKNRSNRHEMQARNGTTDDQHYYSTYEMGEFTDCHKGGRSSHAASPRIARKDIFYSGSLSNLNEFRSNPSLENYIASVTILPQADDKASGVVCGCIPAQHVDTARRMLDLSLLRHPALVLIALSNGVWQAGYMIPLVFIPDFALSIGISVQTASLFISTLGTHTEFISKFHVYFHICVCFRDSHHPWALPGWRSGKPASR